MLKSNSLVVILKKVRKLAFRRVFCRTLSDLIASSICLAASRRGAVGKMIQWWFVQNNACGRGVMTKTERTASVRGFSCHSLTQEHARRLLPEELRLEKSPRFAQHGGTASTTPWRKLPRTDVAKDCFCHCRDANGKLFDFTEANRQHIEKSCWSSTGRYVRQLGITFWRRSLWKLPPSVLPKVY